MTKARKLTVSTENAFDDQVIVRHSEKTGQLSITTASSRDRGLEVTLSPRQTDVLINWILRTKGALDKAAIPAAESDDFLVEEAA